MNTLIHFYCFVGDNCYGNYQINLTHFFYVPRKNEVVMLPKNLSFENDTPNIVKNIVSETTYWRVKEVISVIERHKSNWSDIFIYLKPEDDFNDALAEIRKDTKNELSN